MMQGPTRSRYECLLAEIKAEFPGFRLISKESSALQQLIAKALRLITVGKMDSYLSQYHTTLGQTIYVPAKWEHTSEDARYVTLCHERVHMRQFRRYTWPGMAILYLLVPLPMGFAYFRARFEMQAYAESMRAEAVVGGMERVASAEYREYLFRQFTGASYGWMWPYRRSLQRWYEAALQEARRAL